MKRGRLPLTALRSFEAAGRHLSFSKAAEELFVSQAAISRQIRELEGFLGRPLFDRLHRRVALTDAGQNLLTQLTISFDDIDRRLSAIAGAPVDNVVKVSAEPSFAACWLVPRLFAFRQLRPDIDIAIDVDPRLVEFRTHEAELALRKRQVVAKNGSGVSRSGCRFTGTLARFAHLRPAPEKAGRSQALHPAARGKPPRMDALVRGCRSGRNCSRARADAGRCRAVETGRHARPRRGAWRSALGRRRVARRKAGEAVRNNGRFRCLLACVRELRTAQRTGTRIC
ncbi:LysR substrate binding domain-containing protein [Mesorhizobium albiziae]|uniref:LysR substrate binding domain-containing protein n=1 Tax=Neomesorhizobium albiziae TaxID=335020 RepID=A0A1I4E6E3_9HYPH|nr:LysR substrate binding domain-containing protein [Mesorhizobium albiziae]